MKQVICRTIFLSAVAIAAVVPTAMAQQGQDPKAASNGAKPGLVVTPEGTFAVQEDGSLQSVDAKQGVVATPDGTFTVQQDGSLQPLDAGGPGSVAPPAGTPKVASNNGAKTALPPGVFKAPNGQMLQTITAQSRQQTENALRDALGCTDQEWAILLPKIHTIQALQAAVMPGSPVRAPKGGGDLPPTVMELGNRVQEFHDLVANKDTPNSQVTQALVAVRDARNNVKSKLAQARRDLTELLSLRQEAILFERGILAD